MNKPTKTILYLIVAIIYLGASLTYAVQETSCKPETLVPVKYGQKGDAVKNVQACLIQAGYSIPAGVTGYYGSQTVNAVKKFYADWYGAWSGLRIGPLGIAHLKQVITKAPTATTTKESQPTTPTVKGTIKIGAILPLTGNVAFWGTHVLNGMKIAVEEINSKGGINGREIRLIVEDSKGDPKEGVNAANKLLNIDNVFTLITHTTAVANAVVPLTEEKQIPAIFDAAASAIALNNKFAFKTFYDATKECRRLVDYAVNKKNFKKIGLLLPNVLPYAEDCIKGAKEITNNTIDLRYTFKDTDFRTLLLKARNEKVDALLWIGFPFESNNIHKQRAELGINIPLLCGYKEECISDDVRKNVPQEYLNGTISFDFQDIAESPFGKKYLSMYPDATSENLVPAAFGYDEIMIVATALKDNKDLIKEKFYQDLMKVRGYPSALNSDGFDSNRILQINTRLLEYKNGQWNEI
jgi:branched-chain amino acid transport system substrate-binding protein